MRSEGQGCVRGVRFWMLGVGGDGGGGGGRRQLSTHSTGTSGVTVSLRDGSVTLANTWSRQLSEDTTGTVSWVSGV